MPASALPEPTPFPDHTLESAPAAARRTMAAVTEKSGYLPAAVARLATSPETLDGFLRASAAFESTTLDPLSREVLIMTMATRNDCHVCVAMHTARLTGLGADPALVSALREARPLPDERLEAVREFTLAVLASGGAVDDGTLRAFLGHGYTARNALEVVLGIGAYTMSTLANRMTGAPVDAAMAAYA
ncbi:carboxymuconolactone decarboxylase family protein [Streptomyces sp. NPDC056347]|uniref:carboxymuconolactone decarboxylase family protein n=1 Tax=Streptomyces sp. NPDC056347 TaxID=3345790 RepID=UPI0035D85A56